MITGDVLFERFKKAIDAKEFGAGESHAKAIESLSEDQKHMLLSALEFGFSEGYDPDHSLGISPVHYMSEAELEAEFRNTDMSIS